MSYDPEEEMNYRRKQSGTVLVEQSRMEGLKARIRELEAERDELRTDNSRLSNAILRVEEQRDTARREAAEAQALNRDLLHYFRGVEMNLAPYLPGSAHAAAEAMRRSGRAALTAAIEAARAEEREAFLQILQSQETAWQDLPDVEAGSVNFIAPIIYWLRERSSK